MPFSSFSLFLFLTAHLQLTIVPFRQRVCSSSCPESVQQTLSNKSKPFKTSQAMQGCCPGAPHNGKSTVFWLFGICCFWSGVPVRSPSTFPEDCFGKIQLQLCSSCHWYRLCARPHAAAPRIPCTCLAGACAPEPSAREAGRCTDADMSSEAPRQQPPSQHLRRHQENFLFSYFQAASASLTSHGCHKAQCQKISSLAASLHGLKKYILDYLYHLPLTGVHLEAGGRRRAPEGTRIEWKVFYRSQRIVAAGADGGGRRRLNGY